MKHGARTRIWRAARFVLCALAFVAACGDEHLPGADPPADAGVDRQPARPDVHLVDASAADAAVDAAPRDAAACNVRIEAIPLADSPHVAEGTAIAYASNPPSSGPHYPIWANFQEYAQPVEDGYLVHSMEHGGVLLLYRCDRASCPADVAELRAIRDARPADLLCDPSIRTRVILAPRPANDVAIAAAAWGWIYRADCLDRASLEAFVRDHYAAGPESTCAPGRSF
jgi:hypothetical protein